MAKIRADKLLVERGLCESLDQAQRIIIAGELFHRDQRVPNPSFLLIPEAEIEIRRDRYVSRGGDKLASAIYELKLENLFHNATVLDIGASTGGFTDFALQSGASQVYAVDVGHGHFHWKLRNHPQVEVFERTDIRKFSALNKGPFSVVIGDISFNSIRRLLPAILRSSLSQETDFILLIKPQFELAAEMVVGGIVRDPELQQQALELVEQALTHAGCKVADIIESAVKGRSGNQEYFCHFHIADIQRTKEYLSAVDHA